MRLSGQRLRPPTIEEVEKQIEITSLRYAALRTGSVAQLAERFIWQIVLMCCDCHGIDIFSDGGHDVWPVADCQDKECPLYSGGPHIFQALRNRIEGKYHD